MKLSTAELETLPAVVARPSYDRAKVTAGIAHMGVGGFHRAHEAMYVDALMNRGPQPDGTGLDWGIVGIGTMPGDARMRDALAAQDHLYTLVVKHPDGTLEPRVVGSIVGFVHGPDDPEAVLSVLADPAIRIVSLTVTEGGYHVNQVTGEFDASDDGIQHDLALGSSLGSSAAGSPVTAFGYVVEGLRRRRAAGLPPYTVLSCDNLPGNGDVARRMIVAFARLQDPELADWIEAEVAFPNDMVDRITPVTTPDDIAALRDRFGLEDAWPVVCEPFTQWVVEDHFPLGRPAFEEVGVQLVEDVVPYELMKLRLLNASHQALCYLGYLAGYRYAHEVCADPLFVDFLLGYMEHEATPTLPEVPGVDLAAYRHKLVERFANPEVRDTLARLCAESSDRIPKWLVPVIQHNLAHGGDIRRSALVVRVVGEVRPGVDEQGDPIEVVDRQRDTVMAAALPGPDPLAFLRNRDLFGDLCDQPRFADAYVQALDSLRADGARATLENLKAKEPS